MTDQMQAIFIDRLVHEIADPFTTEEVLQSTDLTDEILDSLGIVEILELIEDVYGIHIDEDSVTRDDFMTILKIESLIAGHLV
jgi:acyl carrier protein